MAYMGTALCAAWGITLTGGVRARVSLLVAACLFQVSVKSLCLWGRVGLITRALGISIRPDPELALALAQPTADAGAPAREGAAAAAGMAEAAAVRLPAATTGSDTPWDLPEAGDW